MFRGEDIQCCGKIICFPCFNQNKSKTSKCPSCKGNYVKNSKKKLFKLASAGVAWAQNLMACHLRDGEDCVQDYKKANEWFLKAIELNNVNAIYNYGRMIVTKRGFEEEDGGRDTMGQVIRAEVYFKRAADMGHGEAQYVHGNNLFLGIGQKKNIEQGIHYLSLANNQGQMEAGRIIKSYSLAKNVGGLDVLANSGDYHAMCEMGRTCLQQFNQQDQEEEETTSQDNEPKEKFIKIAMATSWFQRAIKVGLPPNMNPEETYRQTNSPKEMLKRLKNDTSKFGLPKLWEYLTDAASKITVEMETVCERQQQANSSQAAAITAAKRSRNFGTGTMV